MGTISEITICNTALSMIGQDSGIASLDENTKQARLCKLHYPLSRNSILVRLDWRCAGARARLARLSEEPSFEWAYQYQLPTNPRCLKIRKFIGDIPDKTPYEPEGDRILTNSETVLIKYTFELIDTTKMTPFLVTAIATQLAIALVVPLSSDKSRDQQLSQKLEMIILPQAIASDQSEVYVEDEAGQPLWADEGR